MRQPILALLLTTAIITAQPPLPSVPGDPKSNKFSSETLRAARAYTDSAAIAYLLAASQMQEAAGVKPVLRIPILDELQVLYTRAQDQTGRETTLRRILDTWIAGFGPDELVVANTAESLASLLAQDGKDEQAVQFWNQALTIIRKTLGPNHAATEYALTQLINVKSKHQSSDSAEITRLSDLRTELLQVEAARKAERPLITAYRAGKQVSAPLVTTHVDPQYSELARKQRLGGTVLLTLLVGADGMPVQVEVLRPLGMGLDEAAVAAVKNWVFSPGLKDGAPVAVRATVEVNFRLL